MFPASFSVVRFVCHQWAWATGAVAPPFDPDGCAASWGMLLCLVAVSKTTVISVISTGAVSSLLSIGEAKLERRESAEWSKVWSFCCALGLLGSWDIVGPCGTA